MALPASRSPDELAEMTDEQLQKYFEDHARYFRENPPDSQYAIRLGASSLFSHDTLDLREQFIATVRDYAASER